MDYSISEMISMSIVIKNFNKMIDYCVFSFFCVTYFRFAAVAAVVVEAVAVAGVAVEVVAALAVVVECAETVV